VLGGAASESLHGVRFQDTQQLGLKLWAEGGDFVEEERARIGHLDLAGPGGMRAGECTLFVAEEFRFDQRFR
jgi:hypothetical protein